MTRSVPHVVVIGAGVGGLAAAARLARAGLPVTVLEAHVYPGGSAGTFYHQGYRFDAGATLAGGFGPGGPMAALAEAAGIERWPLGPEDPDQPAMRVHLPGGQTVDRWGGARRWQARTAAFGPESLPFWRWQERTADALWALALRNPPWPPQTPADAARLAAAGLGWLAAAPARRLRPALLADAFRAVAAHLPPQGDALRLFVDAQLLISAQATSERASALYGAAALDLPRRGVAHPRGGIGALAEALVEAVRQAGGAVLLRQQVTRIRTERGRPVAVETKRGESFPADVVIANLPPWNVRDLLSADAMPPRLRDLPARPQAGWGALVVYAGVDAGAIPASMPLHQQVIRGRPLGEVNTAFVSASPAWDDSRAPAGRRALTISTHTDFRRWWRLYDEDRAAYERERDAAAARLLAAAEVALPGLRDAAALVMPGTPITFERFTRRAWGWVGGFPQTNLFSGWGPRLAPGLWLVGDSIFPGQSVPAVALGGLRVAGQVLAGWGEAVEGLAGAPAPASAD